MHLGWTEILLIVVLVILLFGHNKFPGMMKNLADGFKVFKKEMKEPVPAKQAGTQKKQPVKKQRAKKTSSAKK